MAMCCIALVEDAPCQCFSPGSNHTTSPGRSSSIGPPSRCAHPLPNVTINVWPSGCVCHAVRAPGSNVTAFPAARAGAVLGNNGSIRTVPVNQSPGPFAEGCDPLRVIFMSSPYRCVVGIAKIVLGEVNIRGSGDVGAAGNAKVVNARALTTICIAGAGLEPATPAL